MAINCQDVSARMMELLYGELSGDDRAALEAHLVGCTSCAAELAALQSTRAAARRALYGDEPPARAHQAILRAAAAAVAAKQPKPIEARAAAPRPSFWERWRVRWTLPTFATLGAVAVVVLASKVFLEPDKTVERGRQALQSAPAEAPASPPIVAEPQAAVGRAASKEEEQAKQGRPAPAEKERKDEAPEKQQPPAANAPARSIAAPTTAQRRRAAPDGFGALGGLTKGGGTSSSGRAKAPASGVPSFEDEMAGPPPGATKPGKREFAPPPPPLAEPTRPSASAANQMRERDTEGEALEETDAPPRGGVGQVGAGAGPPPAHAAAKAKKVAVPLDRDNLDRGSAAAPVPAPARPQAPAAAPSASMADKADAKSETRVESKSVAESPVARADRLFVQGQWAAAARAYRDLLRRDPNNGEAARWRQRLAASEEAASAQTPAATSAPASGR
jgi:anti-sigma factor RsiW